MSISQMTQASFLIQKCYKVFLQKKKRNLRKLKVKRKVKREKFKEIFESANENIKITTIYSENVIIVNKTKN